MKRQIIKAEKSEHFIGSWIIDNSELMENIVDYFNSNHEEHKFANSDSSKTNNEEKDFIELALLPKKIKRDRVKIFEDYINSLVDCYVDYQNQWNYTKKWSRVHIGSFTIKKFLVSGHHKTFHNDKKDINTSHKLFSWITFLNDVNETGSLEFENFNISIQPKKGLTLIWPSEWTHSFRHTETIKEEKFIIDGSFHFPDTIDTFK